MKMAAESAEKVGAKIHLGGLELDPETLTGLYHESRMDIIPLLYRMILKNKNNSWHAELEDISGLLSAYGGSSFAENLDRSRANWFVKYFEKIAPRQKKVIVDQKDLIIFKELYKNIKGKRTVAVVNQWHMEGIEAHWQVTTGTEPKLEAINPVGDFDIEEYMNGEQVENELRKIVSRITKSEPATWSNHITHYVKEAHNEAHRNRHVVFDDCNDEHMYHGLPYDFHGKNVDRAKQYNVRPNNLDKNVPSDGIEEVKRILKNQEENKKDGNKISHH